MIVSTHNFLKLGMAAVALILLSACVADRGDKRIYQPMEKIATPYESGGIFKAGINEHPLFEERRPRNIGDGLIMVVAEDESVKKKAGKAKSEGDEKGASKDKEKSKDSNDNKDRSEETAGKDTRDKRREREDQNLLNISSDVLVGKVYMTVVDVLENGNLLVTGGKQVIVDDESKSLRITGVVDPNNITAGNMIQSTQVSEVGIQVDNLRIYADGSTSRVNEGNSVFGNFFQSVRSR